MEHHGETVDPWGNRRVVLTATTVLDRGDWAHLEPGPGGGRVPVGDKVKVALDLQAVQRP